jgi:hypothetical protein
MRVLSAVAALLALNVAGAVGQQAPVFRTTGQAVIVDVSVRAGGKPVEGLTARDFQIHEEGVQQEVADVEPFSGTLEVSLVMDEAQLRVGELATSFERTLQGIRSRLPAEDHVQTFWFDGSVVRTVPTDNPLSLVPKEGATLFDAIAAAAMFPRESPERKHVVVAITPGLDRYGALAGDVRLRILLKAGVAVQIVAIADVMRSFYSVNHLSSATGMVTSHTSVGSYDPVLQEVSDLTGGRFFAAKSRDSLGDSVVRAIDDFRTRYWIRYRPTAKEVRGFRRIAIKVTRPGRFDVRYRTGYWRE